MNVCFFIQCLWLFISFVGCAVHVYLCRRCVYALKCENTFFHRNVNAQNALTKCHFVARNEWRKKETNERTRNKFTAKNPILKPSHSRFPRFSNKIEENSHRNSNGNSISISISTLATTLTMLHSTHTNKHTNRKIIILKRISLALTHTHTHKLDVNNFSLVLQNKKHHHLNATATTTENTMYYVLVQYRVHTQNKNSKERQEYWSRKYLNTRKTKYIKNETSMCTRVCVCEYERGFCLCLCVILCERQRASEASKQPTDQTA